MAQTSVSYEPNRARAGLRVYPHVGFNLSGLMDGSVTRANLAGRVVIHEAAKASDVVELPNAAADLNNVLKPRGVVLLQDMDDPDEDADNRQVSYVKNGFIWVPTEDLLTVDTNPFVRFTDPGALGLGAFRSDADTSDAQQVTWARVHHVESASLALLQIYGL